MTYPMQVRAQEAFETAAQREENSKIPNVDSKNRKFDENSKNRFQKSEM